MNYFSPKKNCLYFFTGLIGLLTLMGADVQATDANHNISKKTTPSVQSFNSVNKNLTQGQSVIPDASANHKVYVPEKDNSSPVRPIEEPVPTLDLENGSDSGMMNSLNPEINRFNQVMQYAIDEQLTDRPLGEIMQAIGEQFIGTPYVAGLLDKSNQETLVVTLKGFDCVLFVETVLAIARGVAVQDYSYENFRDRIQEQRYRHGQLNGYCSRLHYFSDWIDDNQNRRIVYNLSNFLGGIPLNTTLNFMTENRQYYPQLANDSEYECILNQEAQLANLDIRYIPQDQIATIYPYLQPGDIIATATDIPGLDVTHTGLVYRFADGGIGFIHASPSGEVKISRDLQSYVQAVDGQIGIIVARPL